MNIAILICLPLILFMIKVTFENSLAPPKLEGYFIRFLYEIKFQVRKMI